MSAIAVALITALSSIATAFITAYFTAHTAANAAVQSAAENQARVIEHNQQQTNDQINRVAAGTAGSLAEGQKLCRVLLGHTWRDGMIVPKDWLISTCQDYQRRAGGTAYQLGCIYTDGTNLGGENGTFPVPNCGWK